MTRGADLAVMVVADLLVLLVAACSPVVQEAVVPGGPCVDDGGAVVGNTNLVVFGDGGPVIPSLSYE